MTLVPGSRVGVYRIDHVVGHNTGTTAYQAASPSGQIVALKIVHFAFAEQPGFAQRWQWEGAARADLHLPHVVAIHGLGSIDRGVYIVTDFMERGALAARTGGPLLVREVVQLLRPIADALDLAHARRQLHRRVTLSNILLDRDGIALLDWSVTELAASALSSPSPAELAAALVPCSPEQARGEPLGPRADQYALASVAHTLLTGRTPKLDGGPREDRHQSELSLARDSTATVEEVWRRALAPSPADRYPTAAAFVTALERASDPPGLVIVAPSADNRDRPPGLPEAPSPTPAPPVDETAADAPRWQEFPPERETLSALESPPTDPPPGQPSGLPPDASLARGSPSGVEARPPAGRVPPRRDGATVLALAIALIAASLLIAYLPSVRVTNLTSPPSPTAGGFGIAVTPPVASTTVPTTTARLQGAVAGRVQGDGATVAPASGPTTVTSATTSLAPTKATPTRATPTSAVIPPPLPTATVNPQAPLLLGATYTVGQNLCDLVVDSAGQRLYVTDDGPERLLVLDAATGLQTRQYDLHDSLCSIALDQPGQTIYAPTWHRSGPTRYDGSQIQAVRLDSGAITTFADDQFPSGPFFDPQRHVVYAGNTAQPTLVSIDTTSKAVLSFPATARINRVAVSSKNGRLYLVSPEDNTVLVYDVAVGKVVTTLTVGQRPWGVVADPVSGRVLVSSELSGGVSLIDPTTNGIMRTTATGSHPRNVAVDEVHGRFTVLNTADRTVSVLSSEGVLLSTSEPLPGGEPLSGIAVATQTGQVFVVSKTHVYMLR